MISGVWQSTEIRGPAQDQLFIELRRKEGKKEGIRNRKQNKKKKDGKKGKRREELWSVMYMVYVYYLLKLTPPLTESSAVWSAHFSRVDSI